MSSIDQTALATVSADRFWPCGPLGITPRNDCLTPSRYGRGTAGANTHRRGTHNGPTALFIYPCRCGRLSDPAYPFRCGLGQLVRALPVDRGLPWRESCVLFFFPAKLGDRHR